MRTCVAPNDGLLLATLLNKQVELLDHDGAANASLEAVHLLSEASRVVVERDGENPAWVTVVSTANEEKA